MARLRIDLQEGFVNDAVVILVNGWEIYEKDSVSTRLQVGFADSVVTDVPSGRSTVEIEVSTRLAKTEFSVSTDDTDVTVDVSLESDGIRHRVLPKHSGGDLPPISAR